MRKATANIRDRLYVFDEGSRKWNSCPPSIKPLTTVTITDHSPIISYRNSSQGFDLEKFIYRDIETSDYLTEIRDGNLLEIESFLIAKEYFLNILAPNMRAKFYDCGAALILRVKQKCYIFDQTANESLDVLMSIFTHHYNRYKVVDGKHIEVKKSASYPLFDYTEIENWSELTPISKSSNFNIVFIDKVIENECTSLIKGKDKTQEIPVIQKVLDTTLAAFIAVAKCNVKK